jgi:4-hydroxy-2-oxoheptanedioate aldolase
LSVEYCRYSGQRGVARYNRSWLWGTLDRSLADVDDNVVCAVQIETQEAFSAVDEIAAVDGVDLLFLGPADLSHSLGLRCAPDAPEMMDVAAQVVAAATANDKAAGVLVGSVKQLRAYHRIGFRFLGCSSDGGLLIAAAANLVATAADMRHP